MGNSDRVCYGTESWWIGVLWHHLLIGLSGQSSS